MHHTVSGCKISEDFSDVQIVHTFTEAVTRNLDFNVSILFNVKCLENGTRAILAMADWHDLLNGAIAYDLDRPSRSFQMLWTISLFVYQKHTIYKECRKSVTTFRCRQLFLYCRIRPGCWARPVRGSEIPCLDFAKDHLINSLYLTVDVVCVPLLYLLPL